MANISVSDLAKKFVDATVNKWGTSEDEVFEVLRVINEGSKHSNYRRKGFEDAVVSLLSSDQKDEYMKRGIKNPVELILDEEMSGSQYSRAMDLYNKGEDKFSSEYYDYFVEGLGSIFDLSNNVEKVVLVGSTACLVGVAFISLPAAAVAGMVMIGGTVIYGAGKIIKNAIEVASADSEAEIKNNLIDLGGGVSLLAMSAPFLPKSIKSVKSIRSARALGKDAPKTYEKIMEQLKREADNRNEVRGTVEIHVGKVLPEVAYGPADRVIAASSKSRVHVQNLASDWAKGIALARLQGAKPNLIVLDAALRLAIDENGGRINRRTFDAVVKVISSAWGDSYKGFEGKTFREMSGMAFGDAALYFRRKMFWSVKKTPIVDEVIAETGYVVVNQPPLLRSVAASSFATLDVAGEYIDDEGICIPIE